VACSRLSRAVRERRRSHDAQRVAGDLERGRYPPGDLAIEGDLERLLAVNSQCRQLEGSDAVDLAPDAERDRNDPRAAARRPRSSPRAASTPAIVNHCSDRFAARLAAQRT
jgi:hypothetical protein